jgi:hypothetical protein
VWLQLLEEVTDKYLSLFTFISHASLYRDWSPVDRIVLLFVFMPLLRAEIIDFVDINNEYPIRAQKNSVHHVSGVPNKLFDDGEQQGFPLHLEALAEWEAKISGFGMYRYLLSFTASCDTNATYERHRL